jgi:CBS domain containing-hemolysin-like protein
MINFIISIIGLILSFFFAGSETAFISTNRFRYELWLKQKKRGAIQAEKYFTKPELFLSTTLVGNNIANILTTSYATVYLITYYSNTLSWLIITLTLLTIGEIIPKVLFRTYANNLILKIIYLIKFFHFILHPLIWLANKVSNFFLKVLNMHKNNTSEILDKTDIAVLVNEGRINGFVDSEEQKIITRVLDLSNKLVREAMIPRTMLKAVDYKTGLNGIKKIITKTGITKIPVYKGSLDNIVGIVFLYDLFFNPSSIDQILSPVDFTPENKRCNELLKEFKRTNTTVSIVIDEYGGTAGIVTVEDLMEEVFGEIEEMRADDTVGIRALNRTTFRIKANETIENLEEQLDIELPDGSYETLGGYIISEMGHIPEPGEQLEMEKFRIVITRSDRKKIHEVRVVLKDV